MYGTADNEFTMRKLLLVALACSAILSWSTKVIAQNVSDSCKVSLMDMVDDDVTDIGSFDPEIGTDKLTTKAYQIPGNIKSKWSFVTVGVLYSNLGIPKDRTDIDEINFILIVSKKAFKQAPGLSLESSLFSDLDGASASVPMKSFDRVEVSKNIIGRDGRLLIVNLECERKSNR
jgi:hypothetical protein